MEAIRTRVEATHDVERVEDVVTIHLAPNRVVAIISADFRDAMAVGDLERLTDELEHSLQDEFTLLQRVYIRPVGANRQQS